MADEIYLDLNDLEIITLTPGINVVRTWAAAKQYLGGAEPLGIRIKADAPYKLVMKDAEGDDKKIDLRTKEGRALKAQMAAA